MCQIIHWVSPMADIKIDLGNWEVLDGIKVLRVGTYMAENKGSIKRSLDYMSFAVSSFFNSLSISTPDIIYSTFSTYLRLWERLVLPL